ncbi:MAG: maltotransferase domain-containing protein, partial [Christiangramia sp.]
MLEKSRIVIENISPVINCGDYPVKRVLDEIVNVQATIFGDGHDIIQASIFYKHSGKRTWNETRMHPAENDTWDGLFKVEKQGDYEYYLQGWEDHGLNWRHGIIKKIEDGQQVPSELLEGAEILKPILPKSSKSEAILIKRAISSFNDKEKYEEAINICLDEELEDILLKYPDKAVPYESDKFPVYVDRKKARFSTWYEFFPRSA